MKRLLIKLISRIFLFPAWFMPFSKLRVFFHRLRGVKIGKGTDIGYFVIIDHNYPDMVSIGKGCGIACKTTILAHDEVFTYIDKKYKQRLAPVKIGNNCCAGTGSVFLPGSEIGDQSIAGANAVVTKRFPKKVVIAGIPAKIIKTIK